MRVKSLIRFIFLVALCTVGAWVARRLVTTQAATAALQYPHVIELGPQKTSEIAEHTFRIGNRSRKAIRIEDIATSCSCAGVERRIDGRLERLTSVTIPAREEHEFVIRIGIGPMPGTRQSVMIYFRGDDEPESQRSIRVVIPRIDGTVVTHPGLVVLGTHELGATATRILDVYDNNVIDFKVNEVLSSRPDRFRVHRLPLTTVDRERLHETAGKLVERIEVTAVTVREGMLDGEIHLILSANPQKQVSIPVCGKVIDRVMAAPSLIVVPLNGDLADRRLAPLILEDRQGQTLTAEIVDSPEQLGITVHQVLDRTDQVRLDIAMVAAGRTGGPKQLSSPVRIRVRAGNWQKIIEIPVVHQIGVDEP